ncbi:MAG: MipA/OmpV family protein [Pseudomonas sp.]|nr:MipA/OmpV family protein [Pseudomonas sp.]
MANTKDTTPSLVGALLLAGISLFQNTAKAANDDEHDQSRWGLGLGGAFSHSPYRGLDNQSQVLPIVSYENRWLSVVGPGLDFKIPSTTALSFRLQARYGLGDGYDASDSDDLAGMHDRDPGVWLGGSAIWDSPIAQFSAQWLGDVSGNSDGQTFKLAVQRRFRANAFDFTPRLAAVRVNDQYVDYYYGVRASEATAVRSAYDGEATVNLEAGLRTGYRLDEHQHLYLDLSVTRLGDEIKDSPIIDRSTQSSARLWYLYRF